MDRSSVKPKIVKKIPGPKAVRWTDFHLKYAARTTYVEGFVWDRTKPAVGPFCTDVDGNIVLDFVSHVAGAPLGYNHPKLLAMMERMVNADPDRYAGCDFINAYGDDPDECEIPTPAHLHHKMVEITKYFGFDTAFFNNSGAEAVENALKICYNKRRNNGYGICFHGAFHGRTLGVLSVNRSKAVQRKWYPKLSKTHTLPYGSAHLDEHQWKSMDREGNVSSLFKQLIDKKMGVVDPDEVAYVIIEPMQGEGGYNVPHKEFIKEIFELSQKYAIPIIADEVQSGLGRTGKWWCCEHFGVKPDIITSAKALRVGATIGKRSMFPDEDGRISSTWGEGNALASAVACRTLEVIQEEKLVQNADKMGTYLRKRLSELRSKHVTNVRGLGLMDAIEFDTKKKRNQVVDDCFKHGLLLLGCGHKAIRFLPPLDVTKREIDLCVDILDKTI